MNNIDTNSTHEFDTSDDHTLYVPAREDFESLSYEGNSIKEKALAVIGAFAVTGLVTLTTVAYWQPHEQPEEVLAVVPKIIESVPQPPTEANPFSNVVLQARSAVVYDINAQKVLYGLRQDEVRPLASLTKLMTALLAVETFEEGINIAIPSYALETEGDSGLFANESWNIQDLISFTMMSSSNDGADALAASVGSLFTTSNETSTPEYKNIDTFVAKMNDRAFELGLQQTSFVNPTGLDEGGRGGGVGTAEDISKLLAYIWEHEPQAIAHTDEYSKTFISEDGFLHLAQNTNECVNDIPGLQGSKTGYTELAGGNLAVVFDAGLDHPIAIVVLGSTLEGRFEDVDTLVEATYGYITNGWYEYDYAVAGSTPTNNKM